MRIKTSVLVVSLFLVGLPMVAQAGDEAAILCLTSPEQSVETVDPLVEGAALAPEVGLFVPEFQHRGCFMDCMNDWESTMCAGLTGTEHQQCVNDGAEGCRLGCGG